METMIECENFRGASNMVLVLFFGWSFSVYVAAWFRYKFTVVRCHVSEIGCLNATWLNHGSSIWRVRCFEKMD